MSSYEQCLTKITTKFLFQDGPNSNRNTGDDLRTSSDWPVGRVSSGVEEVEVHHRLPNDFRLFGSAQGIFADQPDVLSYEQKSEPPILPSF